MAQATSGAPAASVQPAAAVDGWGRPTTDIPADPSVRYGRLPNGMKYAIRQNATPKGGVSMRLHFAFGSLAETERERGLAHFIEHMAFNGTTGVAEGEMKKILERHGLAFGADTNAFTSFDSTIYMLELPTNGDELVDTSLFLLREVAGEVKFDAAAVDRERGVILSEKRARDNYQLRRTLDNLIFHMPASAYTRLPIGTDEVLKTAPANAMIDLYRRYYRPENATLVIAGDIDPAQIEAKIQAKFGGWAGRGPAGSALKRGKVDLSAGRVLGLHRSGDRDHGDDHALPAVGGPRRHPRPPPRADHPADRPRPAHAPPAVITNAPDSKLISAAASQSPARDLAWSTAISAVAPEGEWQGALAAIEQEMRRAVDHGFTDSELKVQLADTHGGLKMAADQASTRRSSALADAVAGVIDDNDIVTTPQFRLDFFREIGPPSRSPKSIPASANYGPAARR